MSGRGALLLLALVALLTLGTLNGRPLYKADESRYAEIPREMLVTGDWVTPRLNGFKYFEKPPLQYWATATFFSVFGEHDWAARLWTALAGLAGIALVFFSGRRIFSTQAAGLGAMVLAGCPLYVLLTQVNTLDMALTFFLSAAVFAFALGRYYLFWAACALAVLSKGLIGIVLPGGAIGLYVLLRRDWALLGRMKILAGGGLFLLISAPWFIAASAANPEFFHFFFVQEHFERFTTKMHGRYQPMWYFVPILAFGIAPWLLPFVASLKSAFRRELGTKAFDAALFLWLWIGLVFAFFSVSGSKLPSYVLPLFPALALLLGRTLSAGEWRWLLTFQTALAALVGLALGTWASSLLARFGLDGTSYAAVLSWSGLGLATAASIALALALARRKEAAVFMLSLASLGCTVTAVDGHQVLSRWFSISAQAAEIEVPPQARMFAVDYYDHTLPWYFRRLVTMVRYKDELGQPIGWEAGKFLPELADFARAWRDAPAAYAVFSTEKFPQLRKEIGVPMDVVSSGPRYTIVRKP